MNTVELFSGCGGLARGLCEAGLVPVMMVEANAVAYHTLKNNPYAGEKSEAYWPAVHSDAREIDWRPMRGAVRIVAGGPPCQPFSQAGRARGSGDPRDMWPEAIRAVKEIRPEAFLFENVRGLLRPNFSDYFRELLSTLERAVPDGYSTTHAMVDAADHGSPQRRHRVIVAGVRRDVADLPPRPQPTHSRERLLWDQWVTNVYWHLHGLDVPPDEFIPAADVGLVMKLRDSGREPGRLRWHTVRDALEGLGEPTGLNGHILQSGARSYHGHTGSVSDLPSKALKAGMHGVPGGENMLRRSDGTVRYFTVREMARLQGLGDDYLVHGNWTQCTRQLGNAVPVPLGRVFGTWIRSTLLEPGRRLAA